MERYEGREFEGNEDGGNAIRPADTRNSEPGARPVLEDALPERAMSILQQGAERRGISAGEYLLEVLEVADRLAQEQGGPEGSSTTR